MVLCVENLKESTEKLLQIINMSINVAGYKVNIKKINGMLHTHNEQYDMPLKNNYIHNNFEED